MRRGWLRPAGRGRGFRVSLARVSRAGRSPASLSSSISGVRRRINLPRRYKAGRLRCEIRRRAHTHDRIGM